MYRGRAILINRGRALLFRGRATRAMCYYNGAIVIRLASVFVPLETMMVVTVAVGTGVGLHAVLSGNLITQ